MSDIRLEGVGFSYPGGARVLDGLDLTVAPGERVAIVGANGGGKTTLARHLVGLLRPIRGRVSVDGQDAATRTVAQLARTVGLLFQQPDRQIFGRSVRAEVAFGPRHLGFTAARRDEAVTRALTAVGLVEDAASHPQDLGDARRKLLTIASVLAMETPIIVLDEPTVGLDGRGIERVTSLVGELHAEGRTVIAISHDMRFVADTFDRVILLAGGRLALDGSPAELFAEGNWPLLNEAGLRPPEAAVLGARLGLGSTPTDASLFEALVRHG